MVGTEPDLRFALDHNFPAPVLRAFGTLMSNVQLVPIREIDPSFAELDDWQLFVALDRHESQWDGLVTNDDKLLALEKEMTVLSQTNLTLIVAKGEGHHPIRAVGTLLCHLSYICHHSVRDRPQVWQLRVTQKDYEAPHDFLRRIAQKKGVRVEDIMQKHRLPRRELGRGGERQR